MTNLPNPVYYDGDWCQRKCNLFCGTETTAKCRLGFAGEDGTCNAEEMIADLVEKSRQTCGACDCYDYPGRWCGLKGCLMAETDGCREVWEPLR